MDPELFFSEVNNAMNGWGKMSFFGNDEKSVTDVLFDDNIVLDRYSIENIDVYEISAENSDDQAITLDDDFLKFIKQLGKYSEDNSKELTVVKSFNETFPYHHEETYLGCLYAYGKLRYGLNLAEDAFRYCIENEFSIEKLCLFAFPHRVATLKDVITIMAYGIANDIKMVWDYSLSDECTEGICKLIMDGEFKESEIIECVSNKDTLLQYFRIRGLPGFRMDDFISSIRAKRADGYEGKLILGLDVTLDNSVMDLLKSRNVMIGRDVIAKYKDSKNLSVIIQFLAIYGNHQRFIESFLVDSNRFLPIIRSLIQNTKIMNRCIEDEKFLYVVYLEQILKTFNLTLAGAESMVYSCSEKIINSLDSCTIIESDVPLLILAMSRSTAFADYLMHVENYYSVYKHLQNYLFEKCGIVDHNNWVAKRFQFKCKSASIVFSSWEFIEVPYFDKLVDDYLSKSSRRSLKQIQNGHCIIVGPDNSATAADAIHDKQYVCSVEAFIADLDAKKLKRVYKFKECFMYNAVRLLESDTFQVYRSKIEDLMLKKFEQTIGLDGVLNFIYHNQEFIKVFDNRNAIKALLCLRIAVQSQDLFDRTCFFVRDFSTVVCKVRPSFDIRTSKTRLSSLGMQILYGNKSLFTIPSVQMFIEKFDVIYDEIIKLIITKATISFTGNELIVRFAGKTA